MGASNVAAAYAKWGHLPHAAFRVLAYMALVSLDADDPPRFWGGRDALALALGREVPAEPAKGDVSRRAQEIRRLRAADHQIVKNAVAALVKAGAIQVLAAGRPGRTAEYALVLGMERGTNSVLNGVRKTYRWGTKNVPDGVQKTYPQGDREEELGTVEEQDHLRRAPNVADPVAYRDASSVLAALPDLGAEFLAQTPESDPLADRVIAAAALAQAAMPNVRVLKSGT